jgi:hypothetical protein
VDGSASVHAPTLWDLATIVLEEVEKVCVDEKRVRALFREVLIHIIQGHVKNMEVIEPPWIESVGLCAPRVSPREEKTRSEGRSHPGKFGG